MCISKRFSNNGATGNHGMQEIDVLKRRMLEDKYQEETSELTCHCGNGCEFTILGEEISEKEAALLSIEIEIENLCPFCKTKNGKINFEYCANNQNKMSEHTFHLDDKVYRTIYKPSGYRFLPPSEIDEQE